MKDVHLSGQSKAVQTAAVTAAKLVATTLQQNDERTLDIIRRFFDEGQEQKRFIDVDRIPFICDDIREIKGDLKSVTRLIYVGVGIVTSISIILPIILKYVVR